MSLEENIKKWVLLDNNIQTLNHKIKTLKEEKSTYNNFILQYILEQNLNNATIKINDGKLRFVNINHSQPLTFRFIYECLVNYFSDTNKAREIINYIKLQRNIKTTTEIKRYVTEEKLQSLSI